MTTELAAEGWSECSLRTLVANAIGGEWGLPPEQADGTSLIESAVIRGTEFRSWDSEKGATAARRAVPVKKLSGRQLSEGDLVLEVSGGGPQQPVGRTVLIDRATLEKSPLPLTCSNFCRRIEISKEVDPVFVWWALRALYLRGDFDQYQTQTTNLRNLNVNDFFDGIQVSLAPLVEQRRIVAKVEELLARVNAARERLAKAPTILKRFRQSVLAAACSGQLTADLRDEATIEGELPNGWSSATVSEICDTIVDCPHSTPKWTDKGEVCLRTTNFLPGKLDVSEVRFVSRETYNARIARLEPRSGDILYSREGGILGIACMFPRGLRACLGQRMMLMRSGKRVRPEYLMHVLNSPATIEVVRELTGGTAAPHLNVGDIKAFSVPLPPLDEQDEILRRSASVMALIDKIEYRVQEATARVEKITQAILSKAFRGELVPTEAELARQENRDYEPASALLERIRAARTVDEVPTKPRRRKTFAGNVKTTSVKRPKKDASVRKSRS